jgi:4-amino-4-deoxy-L-arabinose transferase-like glycosyltransferase
MLRLRRPPYTVSGLIPFFARHYRALALAVLGLAAFNLGFRLNREVVAEWDESLYGLSAWETTQGGHWIATTLRGTVDYYNVKPPLNIWLIALSFKAFGTSLLSLRLASAISAWLTVVVLQAWSRRYFGTAVALLASLVLATSFAFMHVHSGKSANTDALFTLLMLLTIITLCAAERRPRMLAWLGPIAGATFMLKGMAVLMPLLIVLIVEIFRGRSMRERLRPLGAAALLFTAPVGAWIVARWRTDQWRFLERLFFYDGVGSITDALDGHSGNALYYLDILQRHHYDWLVAAAASVLLFPVSLARIRLALPDRWRANRALTVVFGAWIGVTFIVPTLMTTKVPWYLNPFYPVFALGVGWLVVRALSRDGHHARRRVMAAVLLAVIVVAESRLIWTSYYRRDPSRSVQGLLLAERDQLRGHRVYRDERWNNADMFVADALVGAERGLSPDLGHFLRESRRGDYLLSTPEVQDASLTLVIADGRRALYRRNQ